MTTAHADNDYTRLDREDAERKTRLDAPSALADAARWYAAVARWPIFPLRVGGKTPLTAHGFKDATTDERQVNAWWAATPQANIGTPTGLTFDVIDVDGPEGFASLAVMRHHHCPPDCCADVTCPGDKTVLGLEVIAKAYTGGAGRHLLIPPGGQKNGTRLMAGIDYRGKGGYVVLPPSRHESGRMYDWIEPPNKLLFGQAP